MGGPFLKVTRPDGSPLGGGTGAWPLPTDEGPGDWREEEGELVACYHGLHLATAGQLHHWVMSGAVVWEAEIGSDYVVTDNKVVCRRARLLRRLLELDAKTSAAIKRAGVNETTVRDILGFDRPPTVGEAAHLIFGEHRLPAREAESAPAWPSYSTMTSRDNRRWSRWLKGAR